MSKQKGRTTGENHWGLWGKRDRKSTRLNSSHANISYAVFCLKKKNINSSSVLTVIEYVIVAPRGISIMFPVGSLSKNSQLLPALAYSLNIYSHPLIVMMPNLV